MGFGCWGKIVRINLTNKQIEVQELEEEVYRNFLGGSGISAKIIAEEVRPETSPLSPENKLIFMSGPFNTAKVPGSGRWTVSSISPLTNMWGESNGGGMFGHMLIKSGFDGIVLEGSSEKPVYIVINDGILEIKDASHLWGMDNYETSEALQEELGKGYSEVAIGPAGEKKVHMACICSDHVHGHAGRTGMGAVMGSKNLKAIAVKGKNLPEVHSQELLKDLRKKIMKDVADSDSCSNMREYGQPGAVVPREENGLLPMKNWTQGRWQGAEKIGTPVYNEVLDVKPKACGFCPMGCKRWVTVNEGKEHDHQGHGPEYETLAMLGSTLLIDDLKKISYANDLCNRYGIDTMSTGGVIAMMFELYEKGIIGKEFLDGIEAKWGDADAMIALVHKIGKAEGIGKELGKGVKHLSKLIGKRSDEAAVEVRGLEVAAHDPRAYHSMAITYATSPRGACHLNGFSAQLELGALIPELGIDEAADRFSNKNKGYAAAVYQDLAAIHNSLVWCIVVSFADFWVDKQIDILNAVTGWDLDIFEYRKIGERITNLKQLINLKKGLKREDMKLPKRFRLSLPESGTEGHTPDIDNLMEEYIKARNWDENGIPKKEKLKELGLGKYI